jgi:hypothetical protein
LQTKPEKIKRKMEELNMKIIREEMEMATATADCEKNKDALKGMEEPLGSEADRIIPEKKGPRSTKRT